MKPGWSAPEGFRDRKARCIWSLLLTLWPVGRLAEPGTTALQAGPTTTILFMVRLCSLAEPTNPA